MFARWTFVLLLPLLSLCSFGSHAHAAEQQKIVLKNGSVLLGTIVRMDANVIVFRTSQGTLNIQRSQVRSLSSAQGAQPTQPTQPTRPAKPQNPPPDTDPAPNYQPRQPRYQRYQYNRRRYAPRRMNGLLRAGIVTLSASYGAALVIGLLGHTITAAAGGILWEFTSLMVPVAGPFISIGLIASKNSSAAEVFTAPLLLLGIPQVVGLTLLIIGITKQNRARRMAHYTPPPAHPTAVIKTAPPLPSHKTFHSSFSF